ncbi:MAG: hypothetical protein RIK87_29225 [Fuerstiella sp.]
MTVSKEGTAKVLDDHSYLFETRDYTRRLRGWKRGKVVLHAMDADSGKPIPNVFLVIETLKAEQRAAPVGKSGTDGKRRLEMGP